MLRQKQLVFMKKPEHQLKKLHFEIYIRNRSAVGADLGSTLGDNSAVGITRRGIEVER